MDRRSFFKRAGALAAGAAAALYIPAERLDFGVPRLMDSATTLTDKTIYLPVETWDDSRMVKEPVRDDYDIVMGYIRRGEPIPPGLYTISRPINLTGVRGTVRGSGMDQTIIRAQEPWQRGEGREYNVAPGLDARMTGLALPAGWGR